MLGGEKIGPRPLAENTAPNAERRNHITAGAPVQRVLAKLPDAKRHGKGWQARCPAHDDRNPSLSVAEGDDGRALLKCHAGCPTENIVAALGLTMRDLMPDSPVGRSAPNQAATRNSRTWPTPESFASTLPGMLAGVWHYQNADGSPAVAVVRVDGPDGKAYRPLHPVPGGWAVGDPKGPLPLYNLAALADASRVWVVEGEKCVEAMRTIGLVATTTAHGAKSAYKSDWTALAGCDVVILPDNNQAGERYAADVARILLNLNPSAMVRIVRLTVLWPGLTDGGDIVDYRQFQECVSDEDIRLGLEELADKTPPQTPDSIPAPIERDRARNEFPRPVPLSQLGEDAAVPWSWVGYLAVGCITLLIGLWKAGKTTFLAHLLRALGAAGEFTGGAVTPARVLVVSEEGKALWRRRRDELGIGDHVHLMSRPFKGRASWGEWDAFIDDLVGHVKTEAFAVVVFDTISYAWPVTKENDAAEVLAALTPLHRLCEAGAAVLLVHHPRKGDGTEGQAARGSGALGGFVDIILELRRLNPEESEDRRRWIASYSRFDETPREVVIELTDGGYRKIGTKAEAKRGERLELIAGLLPNEAPGITTESLWEKWLDQGAPRPKKRTLEGDLKHGKTFGLWQSTGKGQKGSPFRYHGPNSIRARSGSYGARNESATGAGTLENVIEHIEGAG